jgi:hypothetical protein
LIRVAIAAFLEVVGPKKAERFLNIMAESLASEERLSEVLKIRPPTDDAALSEARREAMLWYRQVLPVFMARLG